MLFRWHGRLKKKLPNWFIHNLIFFWIGYCFIRFRSLVAHNIHWKKTYCYQNFYLHHLLWYMKSCIMFFLSSPLFSVFYCNCEGLCSKKVFVVASKHDDVPFGPHCKTWDPKVDRYSIPVSAFNAVHCSVVQCSIVVE